MPNSKGGAFMVHPLPTQPHIADPPEPAFDAADEPTEAQRLFNAHETNMQNVRERYGADLSGMDAGELLAMESHVIEHLAQLPQQQLTNASDDEDSSLSLAAISRIGEEDHRR